MSPNLRRKKKDMRIWCGFKWPTPRNLVMNPQIRKVVEQLGDCINYSDSVPWS